MSARAASSPARRRIIAGVPLPWKGSTVWAMLRGRHPSYEGGLLPEARLAVAVVDELAVAAHVAVGAAGADVRRLTLPDVAQPANGLRGPAPRSAGPQPVLRAVPELDLDLAAVHEVRLLLALVLVLAGRVALGQH